MKKSTSENKRGRIAIVNIGLTMAFTIFTLWLLGIRDAAMLRWYEEMSLFEPTYLFFKPFLYYPGGLLRYAGTFLTQFLYYPLLGALLFAAIWLLTAWLSRLAFGFSHALWPLALLLPLCLFVTIALLDEAWLSLKTPGYLFSNSLGFLWTILSYLLFRIALRKRLCLGLIVALLIPLFYPIAGFFALSGSLLCIIGLTAFAIREKSIPAYAVVCAVAVLLLSLPKLYYTYLHGNTVDDDYLYMKGLPELLFEKFDIYLWRPLATAILVTLLSAIAQVCGIKKLKESVGMEWCGIILVAGGVIWCLVAGKRSEQFRATVHMLHRIERNDWNGVLKVMSLIKEQPNYTMLVYSNLATVNLGGKSRSLGDMRPAPADARHSEIFTVTAFIQVPVNYHIGRFNESYRWAMEHTVQYGKRVFFLKYMVKDALLNGEYRLASRYNDILRSTMFHRQWAEEIQRYIDNPELIKDNPEFATALRMNEAEKVRIGLEMEVKRNNAHGDAEAAVQGHG